MTRSKNKLPLIWCKLYEGPRPSVLKKAQRPAGGIVNTHKGSGLRIRKQLFAHRDIQLFYTHWLKCKMNFAMNYVDLFQEKYDERKNKMVCKMEKLNEIVRHRAFDYYYL